jgi:hypothetical protein
MTVHPSSGVTLVAMPQVGAEAKAQEKPYHEGCNNWRLHLSNLSIAIKH